MGAQVHTAKHMRRRLKHNRFGPAAETMSDGGEDWDQQWGEAWNEEDWGKEKRWAWHDHGRKFHGRSSGTKRPQTQQQPKAKTKAKAEPKPAPGTGTCRKRREEEKRLPLLQENAVLRAETVAQSELRKEFNEELKAYSMMQAAATMARTAAETEAQKARLMVDKNSKLETSVQALETEMASLRVDLTQQKRTAEELQSTKREHQAEIAADRLELVSLRATAKVEEARSEY